MGAHVDKLVGICFFHLRQLRMVRRALDVDAAHALVRALIHSRFQDYCNNVLAGLPAYMFKRLQSVLKAAARLVLQLPGRQSVNPDGRDAALARISTLSHVQAVRPGLQRSAWIGTQLLVQTMCSSSRRSWPCTSQVGFSWTAHGANYEQKDDWKQRVLTLWPCGMEQSSSASAE